jgi:hypothetical protein
MSDLRVCLYCLVSVLVLVGLTRCERVMVSRSSPRFLPAWLRPAWVLSVSASRRAGFALPGRARLVQVERPYRTNDLDQAGAVWSPSVRGGCSWGGWASQSCPGPRAGSPGRRRPTPGCRAGGPARRRRCCCTYRVSPAWPVRTRCLREGIASRRPAIWTPDPSASAWASRCRVAVGFHIRQWTMARGSRVGLRRPSEKPVRRSDGQARRTTPPARPSTPSRYAAAPTA